MFLDRSVRVTFKIGSLVSVTVKPCIWPIRRSFYRGGAADNPLLNICCTQLGLFGRRGLVAPGRKPRSPLLSERFQCLCDHKCHCVCECSEKCICVFTFACLCVVYSDLFVCDSLCMCSVSSKKLAVSPHLVERMYIVSRWKLCAELRRFCATARCDSCSNTFSSACVVQNGCAKMTTLYCMPDSRNLELQLCARRLCTMCMYNPYNWLKLCECLGECICVLNFHEICREQPKTNHNNYRGTHPEKQSKYTRSKITAPHAIMSTRANALTSSTRTCVHANITPDAVHVYTQRAVRGITLAPPLASIAGGELYSVSQQSGLLSTYKFINIVNIILCSNILVNKTIIRTTSISAATFKFKFQIKFKFIIEIFCASHSLTTICITICLVNYRYTRIFSLHMQARIDCLGPSALYIKPNHVHMFQKMEHSGLTPDFVDMELKATDGLLRSAVGAVTAAAMNTAGGNPCPDTDGTAVEKLGCAAGDDLCIIASNTAATPELGNASGDAPCTSTKNTDARPKRSLARKNKNRRQVKAAKRASEPAAEKSKRLRSDDSPEGPDRKKQVTVTPPRKPEKMKVHSSADQVVVIDNLSAADQSITQDQVELIRFEIASLVIELGPEEEVPTFVYSGCKDGRMRITCQTVASKAWLLSSTDRLNGSIDGASLRMRILSEIPTPVRISGFLPLPKSVDRDFVMKLLLRQNPNLGIERWFASKFDEVSGKDPAHPMIGAGYFVMFEIDEESMAKLQEASLRVFFAATTVAFTRHDAKRSAPAKEVSLDNTATQQFDVN